MEAGRPDRKLYVERWLLELRAEAVAAGLEAWVRALDRKGGRWLSFSLRAGEEALEFRIRKRPVGPAMVAASTGGAIAARAREVYLRLLRERRRLLENGLRRFLRRSVRLLEALESAFDRDAGLPSRIREALRAAGIDPAEAGARPAALARKRRGSIREFEVLPAVAFFGGGRAALSGLSEGTVMDLSGFIRKAPRRMPREAAPRREEAYPGPVPDGAGLAVATAGAAPAAVPGASGKAKSAAAEVIGAMADVIVPVGEIAGSCLSDAACSGLDCGGLDCIPF